MLDQEPDDALFHRMARTLRDARRLVVFTGAGVSAESGIGTFRDDDGLWARFPPEQFANWPGLLGVAMEEPCRAAEFLLALLEPIAHAQPNAAHRAIAQIESHLPVTVVTQNVDGLHELAGSNRIHSIHGTLFETVYVDGRSRGRVTRAEIAGVASALQPLCTPATTVDQLQAAIAPLMGAEVAGMYRPKIVLFGDALAEPDWTAAQEAVSDCDLLLVVGTSGMVYPAAMLPDQARRRGATVAAIDPEPVEGFIWLEGMAGEVLPALVAEAFG